MIRLPFRLPVQEILPALRETLAANPSVVVTAPPGAGKTTVVPLSLLEEPWLANRSILILEPRRLAARAAAARMADLLGEPVGETVGYRIRFDVKVSEKTRVEVLTEGILTRRLQSDPGLEGVGLVIFDEFHERHLHADLALALCLDSRRMLREDLKLLVMSATLDAQAVSALLGRAPVLSSPGRLFPVEVLYAAHDPRDTEARMPETVQQSVLHALRHDRGDVLVFLPGAREIRRTQEGLEKALTDGPVDLFPLYGDLPWEAQDRAIRPTKGARRKVVLATPIAETSLTIEGIGVVIDSGLVRVPEFDPRTGLTGLTTVRVSRASAEQRAGRAGRLGPGVCYRLWSEAAQRGLTERPIPEIRAADLTPFALELAQWGARDPETLSWLDPPPEGALARARILLAELGAIDPNGAITPAGRSMAALPVHPRLAHMILEADALGLARLACDIAALLSERDPLSVGRRQSADFLIRLEALQAFRTRGGEGAMSFGADPAACRRAEQASRQFLRLIQSKDPGTAKVLDRTGLLLAFAYPDRIAQQRSTGDVRYLLASGRGARLPGSEHRMRPPYLVAASLDAGETEGTIHLAAPVELDALREHLGSRFRTEDVVRWDAPTKRIIARREERLGQLLIGEGAIPAPDPEKVLAAALEGVRSHGLGALPWTRESRDFQARVLSLRQWLPQEKWPDLSDGALNEAIEDWLGPFLGGVKRLEDLAGLDLLAILRTRLDGKQQRRLEEGAPTHLTVPSGSRLRLEYRPGESPVLAVKLQEMFGLADTPRVAFGKIPVTLHLLSPGRQPIQVTQDLRGFWERTYAEVKKELKGRYPKHPWPDDPWKAAPTARTKPRPR
ncbi:MAG TPA: ATP-dependent helicase HrpB [Nitrospiria bacterium]|jgi:ATP-dependent helicase HrpB|nr:ATP-dependent helicase HrpB [Nitrospiria bacterium]